VSRIIVPAVLLLSACTAESGLDTAIPYEPEPVPSGPVGVDLVEPIWMAALGEDGEPNELQFDALGRLWAGDVASMNVAIFDVDGTQIGTVGGEGDAPGLFMPPLGDDKGGPEAIQFDDRNQAYVVDRGGDRIHVYDADTLTWVRTLTSPRLEDPTGMAIDADGNLYLADQALGAILKFTNAGEYLMTFQTRDASGEPILNKTETLALIEPWNLLIATSEDDANMSVFLLDTGAYSGLRIGGPQVGPVPEDGRFGDDIEGIAIDPLAERLYTSDEDNGRIMIHDLTDAWALDPDGTLYSGSANYGFVGAFGTKGDRPGQLKSADGVAVSSDGRVAIADQGNERVQVFAIPELTETIGL